MTARHTGRINVAVRDPAALVTPPRPHSSWALLATGTGLLATRETSVEVVRFTAEQFGL